MGQVSSCDAEGIFDTGLVLSDAVLDVRATRLLAEAQLFMAGRSTFPYLENYQL